MSLKIKQEKIAPELENARSKLEEALQYIVEKAEESPSTSEDEFNKGLTDVTIKKELSPVPSPKKPTQRIQRKRRRKDESLLKNANSYVMKLFDRAVDLTPFKDQTPLYPICRAWINNQALYKSVQPKEEPTAQEAEIVDEAEKCVEENTDEVHQLPAPSPLIGKDLRIPSPVPQPKMDFVISSDDPNKVSREALMAGHLQRWKAVRKKWKEAAKANEDRYRESATILKSMFEKSQCNEEIVSNDPWDISTVV